MKGIDHPPTGASKYGKCYWNVHLTNGESVWFFADRLSVSDDGSLIGRSQRQKDSDPDVTFAAGAGQWSTAYAADVTDGQPVAVEHWDAATAENKQPVGRRRTSRAADKPT
jgi:hypothetical protein